ncbi:MAG TPA: hypothetical protein DCG85_02245 [Lachnospiraceae bacterium]|nr:hypothetical protein [Lachnospiraceae bacterium]
MEKLNMDDLDHVSGGRQAYSPKVSKKKNYMRQNGNDLSYLNDKMNPGLNTPEDESYETSDSSEIFGKDLLMRSDNKNYLA